MPFNPLQYPLENLQPRLVSAFSSWLGHIPFAFALVQMARPRTIVELGVLQGDSYYAFCQAAAALQLPVRCWGVDLWPGDPQAGINGDEMLTALKQLHDPEMGRFSQLIRSSFQQAAGQFTPGSIDLLHLDGNPSYAALRQDLNTWLPKMSDRGIILLYGINRQSPDGGAKKLWAELSSQNRLSFAFEHAGGLGVFAWGNAVPAPVSEFLREGKTDPRAIRAHFARLGESIELTQIQRRLIQSLVNTQISLNEWKKKAGHWVDPKGVDVRMAHVDTVRFSNTVGDQVRFALTDDLLVRGKSAAADTPGTAATEPADRPAAVPTTFSVIICSIDSAKFTAAEQMYRRLLGDSAQIIRIPDARGMCEGYNRGIDQSTGELLIFSHDDVEILSPDFAQKLQKHLQTFDMVGLAGTTRLCGGAWVIAGPPYVFGQVAEPTPEGDYAMQFFGGSGPVVGGIEAVDGLMFAVRRAVVEKVRFDESFDSFHLYDLDFSASVGAAGFRLAVARDIWSLHSSAGKFDQRWQFYASKFEQKWAARLKPKTNRPFHNAIVRVRTKDEIVEVARINT
jgi:hypothetical protein